MKNKAYHAGIKAKAGVKNIMLKVFQDLNN